MSYARLVLFTQIQENYGDEDQPYWKTKCGGEVLAAVLDVAEASQGQTHLEITYAAPAADTVQVANSYFQEYVIGWDLFWDNEPTPDERLQLEYEGRVNYPPTPLAKDEGAWCPIGLKAACPV